MIITCKRQGNGSWCASFSDGSEGAAAYGDTESIAYERLRNKLVRKSWYWARAANEVLGAFMSEDTKVVRNKDIPVEDVGLSVRALNCLWIEGLKTLGDVAQKARWELLLLKNFGEKTLTEVREKLAQYDLSLKDE